MEIGHRVLRFEHSGTAIERLIGQPRTSASASFRARVPRRIADITFRVSLTSIFEIQLAELIGSPSSSVVGRT